MSLPRLFIFIGLILLSACHSNQPQDTTVYLVRHAEKDLTDPSAKNPPLSPVGVMRAQHLADRFDTVPLDAIYSTPFDRNKNTVKPLADRKGLKIQLYNWHDYQGIQRLLTGQSGNTILLCGHGDNLLPIIKNAGGKPPLGSIGNADYQYVFKLVIHPNGTAQATVQTYH